MKTLETIYFKCCTNKIDLPSGVNRLNPVGLYGQGLAAALQIDSG